MSQASACITLLTDFGLEDVYVGVMKGIILGIYPQTSIIDLTHQICPQDISSASYQLGNAFRYFPKPTIHVAVVDPGVGSSRAALAIQTDHGIFVGPNNGIFSHVLSIIQPRQIVELNNPDFWYSSHPSNTFHGRDIFAPIAGHLAKGIALEELGSPLSQADLILSTIPTAYNAQNNKGLIQAIDHFGNLITTIPAKAVAYLQERQWSLILEKHKIPGGSNYSQVASGEAIALQGSHGWLEIAINQGNAQQFFKAQTEMPVQLIITEA